MIKLGNILCNLHGGFLLLSPSIFLFLDFLSTTVTSSSSSDSDPDSKTFLGLFDSFFLGIMGVKKSSQPVRLSSSTESYSCTVTFFFFGFWISGDSILDSTNFVGVGTFNPSFWHTGPSFGVSFLFHLVFVVIPVASIGFPSMSWTILWLAQLAKGGLDSLPDRVTLIVDSLSFFLALFLEAGVFGLELMDVIFLTETAVDFSFLKFELLFKKYNYETHKKWYNSNNWASQSSGKPCLKLWMKDSG